MTLPPKTSKSFTVNSIKRLFYWNLMLSVTYFARRLRTWPAIPGGRAAEDMYSDSKWKLMTGDCPSMGREGGLSSGWGMLAGLSCCSLKISFVTPLPSLFLGRETPAGRSKGRGRRQNGRQRLKWVCLHSPGSNWGQTKSLVLHLLLKGGCFWVHPCARWGGNKYPHMQMRMAESTSAVVPGSSGSLHKQQQFVSSPDIYLWSGEEGWALAGQQSREINRRIRELIMSCRTIPYLVTRWKVAQSIKQPSNRPVAGLPQWK